MDLLHIRLVNSGGDMKTKTVKRQEILLKLETELKELNNWLIQVNRGRVTLIHFFRQNSNFFFNFF